MPDLVVYKKLALTGGGATALDGIDGSSLTGNELAFVTLSGVVYHYILEASSGAAESSPSVISPDANAGTKRWILQTHSVKQGGTGLTTYTIGDLLYASAADTIAKLADVATGQVLVSGGVGTAPAYSDSPTLVGVTLGNTGLHLLDTNASHDLIIAPGSDLTADHTLSLVTGDADRTITLSGNPTLNDWFDQSVKAAASPTFANITDSGLTSGRVPYASTAGLLVDSANLLFNGTTLTINAIQFGTGGGNSLYNVAAGYHALQANTTGTSNTAVGFATLLNVTGSTGNTAIGAYALYSATGGDYNTAVGINTLMYLATGARNTAIGQGAFGGASYNGSYSTALGFGAGNTVTSGEYNTLLGYLAGSALTTGSNNTYLGGFTGTGFETSSNNIFLSDGAGNVRIMSDTSGNVGIGTIAPLRLLHVGAGSDAPDITGTVALFSNAGTTNVAIRDSVNNVEMMHYVDSSQGIIGMATNHPLYIRTNNTDAISIDTSGNFVIGNSTANGKLDVWNGNLTLSDSDVAHGMTDWAATTVYGKIGPQDANAGGLAITGLSDAPGSHGLVFTGLIGDADPTDTIAATLFQSARKSGTTWAALAATETAYQFKNYTTALLTIMGDGTLGIIKSLDTTMAGNDTVGTGGILRYRGDGAGSGAWWEIRAGADKRFAIDTYGPDGYTERFCILPSYGNIGLNTTSFGTSAAKVLALGAGTAPTTSPADVAQTWVADYNGTAGDARFFFMGESSANKKSALGSGTISVVGTAGGYTRQLSEATATLSGASTTIQVNIPATSRIIGCQLRVDTAITSGDGATSWAAAYSGGASDAIASGQAFTKNTKVNSLVTATITSEADIVITPNSGTFNAGVIRAIVYYETFDTMADAA